MQRACCLQTRQQRNRKLGQLRSQNDPQPLPVKHWPFSAAKPQQSPCIGRHGQLRIAQIDQHGAEQFGIVQDLLRMIPAIRHPWRLRQHLQNVWMGAQGPEQFCLGLAIVVIKHFY
ncbi:hypothetical protein [Paracoccus alcaliphilus]|uniref:hypothetical protein n=1 Tax=Paracoccus alcaliphilus TaxID=34002 RepID=UPI0011138D5D|nr:hypothetical protein [Paracoccus alcaliphilus]WCR17018.1 hypothetical protein JHW40_11490 [Paracoccus alcaliphilus]